MKMVHVECLPDELLIKNLGFNNKAITHHTGKSRVFNKLKQEKNQLALVDEDPGSVKTDYEKKLKFIEEVYYIKCYIDNSGNKVFILKGKLEDWVIRICKQYDIKLNSFGLPNRPNKLHDVINQRLNNFDRLIKKLLEKNNPAILKLKSLMK